MAGLTPWYVWVMWVHGRGYVEVRVCMGWCLSLISKELHPSIPENLSDKSRANSLVFSGVKVQMFSANGAGVRGAGFADAFRVGGRGGAKHI